MSDAVLSILCLVATLVLYYANKKLYRRFHKLPLMPLVFTPILLVLILVVGHISYQSYMGETHWLLWLLGPRQVGFSVSAKRGIIFPPRRGRVRPRGNPLPHSDRTDTDCGWSGGCRGGRQFHAGVIRSSRR